MDDRLKFSSGDWIEGPEGIGQVFEMNSVFFEENYSMVASNQKNVGDLANIIVIYKVFCDHNFKIKKRNRWYNATNSSFRKIKPRLKGRIDKIIESNVSEFNKYEKDEDCNWMGQGWLFDGLIYPEFKNKYIDRCELIAEELEGEFKLPRFQECLYKHSMPIPICPDPSIIYDYKGNLRIKIFNKLFRNDKNRAVYTSFIYEFIDNYEIRKKSIS